MLKSIISLSLVDPLTSDETSTRRKGNEISRADVGKSINLRCHHMKPFGMNNLMARSCLGKSCAVTIAVNRQKCASSKAISRLSWRRCVANERRYNSRGRWLISRIYNPRTTGVVKLRNMSKRRNIQKVKVSHNIPTK